ncbi:MAG TPA: PSD1 and planctomycete cytochrome C domain-containing protein [Bryobacteraceae bacterium]|nr:PSD1 and planctomycete cytochrome C domain-containing protein [Bryobacteraceae bacterium]
MLRTWTLSTLCFLAAGPARPAEPSVDFQREVKPILVSSCLGCHTGAKAGGQWRVDSKALAMKGGISGPVIVPGNSAQSRLMHRVLGKGGEKQMPLGGQPLTPVQIATLQRWIDAGAPWVDVSTASAPAVPDKHWAYRKPVRPELPATKQTAWVRNPIDNFILARLDKEGLAPSREASRETLIRRLSLDLTGLPPSLAEVDAFVSDTSPQAYEKVVDRLLSSPHYGERWARPWLDLARYADTNGHEADRRRSIWKYRDWVIAAFNQDMPFDRFTVEQIAGDMLPNPTPDQLIATGFHRNTMYNEEGGVDKDEAHWENLVDRVNTTATVWLGSTVQCSQCHNHKYDPFTQKEYYQLVAFFNNSDRTVREYSESAKEVIEPRLFMPTPEQSARKKVLEEQIRSLDRQLKTATPELAAAQTVWENAVRRASSDWKLLPVDSAESAGGSTFQKQPGGSLLVTGKNPTNDTYVIEATLPQTGITGIRLEALPHSSLPRGGPGRDAYGNFFLTEVQAEFVSAKSAEKLSIGKVFVDDGKIEDKKFKQLWIVDATRDETRLPRQIVFVTKSPSGSAGDKLRLRIHQSSEAGGQGIGHFRLSVTSSPEPNRITQISAKNRGLLDISESVRTEPQKQALADFYRTVAPSLDSARDSLKSLRKELENLGIVSTLIMGEQKNFERPSTVIRVRGSFMDPGEKVYANVPAVLNPLPESELPNRLGLARWLVSPENPLTARVAVNRLWEQYFGIGIVETSEDFGSQGHAPSHPELLDWLASELMARKWSLKAMHRLIVTSAAYRQDSAVSPALLGRDPYNRLLARGPRFRMEAEMVRDVSLAASGLLSAKIGGSSVFPYQPDGVWDLPYNDDAWVQSKNGDQYRRGLYTFLRRTSPYPSMLTFDAPSRELCTVRRVRTNTPLQGLTTLNDPAFFDTAKALAARMLREAKPDTRSRAEHGFRLCVARKPSATEVDRLVTWVEKEKTSFAGRPAEAAKLGAKRSAELATTDAEFAAWTMLANVLLNLDETLTKQ